MDNVDISHPTTTRTNVVDKETKWVECAPVMVRIRHILRSKSPSCMDIFREFDHSKTGSISIGQFHMGMICLIGKHDFNNEFFDQLVRHYKNPDRPEEVLWKNFQSDVESGFEQVPTASVPRQEIFRVPKPGTVDWNDASQDHVDLYSETMHKIRQRVEHRRILMKPTFQDFDRHKNGHITRSQFRKSFIILDIPIEEKEMDALEALYCNDTGVNYIKFLADLEPSEPVPFMYVKRMEEIRQTNAKKVLPEQRPKSDLEDVLIKIKTKVYKERIIVLEFVRDYDKLRSGRVLKRFFRQALDFARLNLYESEIAMLEDKYQYGGDEQYFEYRRFCNDIESIFTKDHLEKNPLENVEQFKPDEEWTVTRGKEEEEKQLSSCLSRIAENVYKKRKTVLGLMRSYDNLRSGCVLKRFFRQALDMAGLNLYESEIAMLEDKYQFGSDEQYFEYRRFCNDIESIFTKDHLEKNPLENVEQFKPDEEWTVTRGKEEMEKQLSSCLSRIAENVGRRQIQLFPLFVDYDEGHKGTVSQSQFRRVLMELELGNLAGDTDIKLIWKKYQVQVRDRIDVNYVAFCYKIDELAGFEFGKP